MNPFLCIGWNQKEDNRLYKVSHNLRPVSKGGGGIFGEGFYCGKCGKFKQSCTKDTVSLFPYNVNKEFME